MTESAAVNNSDSKWLSVVWHVAATLAILYLLVWWGKRLASGDETVAYPNRSIEVVVPYPAGGGSDTFVRTLQKGFVEDNLLPQPLAVINVAGGGGTIGSRDVKDAKPDGYRILCHHNAIITAKLSDTVDYGPEAFESIALTGAVTLVIIVREDAPYSNVRELLDAAKESPKELTFGANQGAPAYFATLQLEKHVPGAKFSIVSADGGADRYSKILGGHLTAGIFSLSEYLDFRGADGTPPDQNIRAIAVLGHQRHPALPDVETTVERELPVTLSNANYWWAPKGTPQRVLTVLADALEKAMQNETVRSELTRLRVDLEYSRGQPFRDHIAATAKSFESAAAKREKKIPEFTTWVGWIVFGLLIWVLVDATRQRNGDPETDASAPEISLKREEFVRRPGTAAACFVVLMLYVYVLGQHWLPFAVATGLMVITVGGLMTRWQRQHWIVLLQLSLLTGLGVNFIFTEIFTTTLP